MLTLHTSKASFLNCSELNISPSDSQFTCSPKRVNPRLTPPPLPKAVLWFRKVLCQLLKDCNHIPIFPE